MKRKKILKEAGILLVVAALFFSTVAVTANTEFKTDEKLISDNPGLIRPIEAVKEITEPSIVERANFLGYDDGYTENSWAYTGGEPWEVAIQLTDALLAPYRGEQITEVMFSCGCDDYGFEIADYEIWISDVLEDPTAPSVVYKTGTSSGTGWDTVTLDMAYDIPDTGDVYVGITYSNYGVGVAWPAGVDETNYVAEGFWFYYSGWIDGSTVLGEESVWGLSAGVTGEPAIPAICCEGSLSFTDVSPGGEVTGTFEVCNCGEEGSFLNWQFDSAPDWEGAVFEIEPDSGTGLAYDDCVEITVTVTAPDIEEETFTGKIKMINSDDPDDYCEVDITLTTPRTRNVHSLFAQFFQQFPNAFPLLRQILGL